MKLLNLFTDKSQENAAISAARSFFHRVLQMRRNFLTTCTQKSTQGKNLQAQAFENAENGADKVLFKSEKNSSVHKKYMNFSSARKRALDVPLYAFSGGRSMVEMLGVLAIIGVLSVGGISGYGKAMMKYKLNKHAEAFNILLNNAIRIRPEFDRAFNGISLTDALFNTLKLIPDGMTYRKNFGIYDVFQNRYHIQYNDAGHNNGTMHYYMGISLDPNNSKFSNYSLDVCRNIFITAKENADNIYSVQVRSNTEDSYVAVELKGGLANGTNTLKNADLQKIHEVCDSCDSELGCYMILYLDIFKRS